MPETNSARAAAILDDLRGLIAGNGPISPLAGEVYMRTHVAFEESSNQQAKILDWLVDHLDSSPQEPLELTSVGAGSGILDVPMLEQLGQRRTIDYQVIEPIAEQCEAFRKHANRLSSDLGVSLDIRNSTLEDVETEREVDHVLVIHSIYYFPALPAALEKLVALAKPGGEVVIAVAPFEQMNQLAEVFWQPQSTARVWFEADVLRALEALGLRDVVRERIEGELVLEPGTPATNDILGFLLQCSLESLPREARALVLAYLEEVGQQQNGQLLVPHPVSLLRFRGRPRAGQLRPAAPGLPIEDRLP